MKRFLILTFLISSSVFAEDVFFQIQSFTMTGDQGKLVSNEYLIKSPSGNIGFKSYVEQFHADITIVDKIMTIQGYNGTFIRTDSPVDIESIPPTELLNGSLIKNDTTMAIKAGKARTSISNFALDADNLDMICENNSCRGSASHLTIDRNLQIANPTLGCVEDACINNFSLTMKSMRNGQKSLPPLMDKGFIDLEDLHDMSLRRVGDQVYIDGRAKVPLFGDTGFVTRSTIITLNDTNLDLRVDHVKVGSFTSLTEFIMLLARNILSGKQYTIKDNVISIRLK